MPLTTKLFAHLETWRPYTACYVGLVGLAGASLSPGETTAGRLFAAWAIPTLAWMGALYGGDWFDRELDAVAKPQRPVPSGRMAARTALSVFIGCVAVGAVWSLLLNWRTAVLVGATCGAGIAYSKVLKGRGLAGNLARGAMTSCALLFGAMLALDWPPVRIVPVALVFLLHDAASNLVGAVRDVDGDREGGYVTFAVAHGVVTATRVAAGLLAGAYALAVVISVLLPGATGVVSGVALVAAAASAAWAVAPVARSADRRTAYTAHTVLVFTRILLAGSFLALDLDAAVTVPVVLAALAVTFLSQRLLRERHEFTGVAATAAVMADDVVAFIDRNLAGFDIVPGLAGWRRSIDVRLTDPDLSVRLDVRDGAITRTDPTTATDEAATVLTIVTTGRVFGDIFLTGRSNPRRAYLTRQLAMSASPADMIRLNQLFNAFRHTRPTPAPAVPAAHVTEREPVAVGTVPLPGTVVVSDTTLRDGEQMPGVVFSPGAKLEIAQRLAAAGIPLIEAGFPAVSTEEAAAIRSIVELGTDALVQVIARPLDRDVDAAIATGAHSIAIFIGTSDSHMRTKLRMTENEVRTAVDRAVRRAKQAGRQVVFAAEDATRTDLNVLRRICLTAADAGADTLGIADTVGIATPTTMARLVRDVADACPLPVAVHCHNDLGLATANSLAGVDAGASGVQCSLLGIGERAGNAPLEQVALGLHVAMGRDTGLDLTALHPLAGYVARLIDVPVPPYQPVSGANAFTHESGLHLDGINQDATTYEPYSPEVVGRTRRIVLGKHSGVSSVRAVADTAGIALDDEQARAVLVAVKDAAQRGELDPSDDATALVSRFATRSAPVPMRSAR